jgi:hypothetical protein
MNSFIYSERPRRRDLLSYAYETARQQHYERGVMLATHKIQNSQTKKLLAPCCCGWWLAVTLFFVMKK